MVRAGLTTGSIVVGLLLLEGGLRLYHVVRVRREISRQPPVEERALVPSHDAGLIYEFNPGWSSEHFSVNSHGMADDEVSPEKPEGVVRIAFVGDSVTANFQLTPRPQTYPRVIRELLNASAPPGTRFDSLNFGVNGYAILQSLRMAQLRVPAFDPDVLVVQVCLNDPKIGGTLYAPDPSAYPLLTLEMLGRRLWPLGLFVHTYYDDEGWSNVRRAFEGFAEIARGGLPTLVVLFSHLYAPAYAEWHYGDLHARYREEARLAGLPFLDLFDDFQAAGLIQDPRKDWIHPDPDGHRVAAESIVAELRARQMVPPPDA